MEEDPKSQRISGSGKSHIAIGLGLAACEKGLSVGFITAASLVHELIEAHDDKRRFASAAPTGRPQVVKSLPTTTPFSRPIAALTHMWNGPGGKDFVW